VISIAVSLFLLAFFLRRRSKARRDRQAHQWWFSRTRTSRTYGDRNSAEIFGSGVHSARSSFATTVDHSFLARQATTIPPLPPMAEVGRANASALPVLLDPSHFSDDNRFSLNSNHSENSQFLFVNIRNSLQDLTPKSGKAFSPSESFAFPKPPSPIGDRVSAYSRRSTSTATANAMMRSMRTNSDDSHLPSLPDVPPSPVAGTPTGANPFSENPFSDNNPFEDHQITAAQAITPTAFAEMEVIRRAFRRNLQDEITVNSGEFVRVLKTFDDGWAYVAKTPAMGSNGIDDVDDGTKGLIPIDCLREPGQDLPAFISANRLSDYTPAGSMDHTT